MCTHGYLHYTYKYICIIEFADCVGNTFASTTETPIIWKSLWIYRNNGLLCQTYTLMHTLDSEERVRHHCCGAGFTFISVLPAIVVTYICMQVMFKE